jgi:hypothetical protein
MRRFVGLVSVLSLVFMALPLAQAAADGACPSFSPSGTKKGFLKVSTKLFTAACSPNHRGRDKIVNPGARVDLIGKFAYCALTDKDLEGEWVQTWVQGAQCGWSLVSRKKTSGDHSSTWVDGVQDDGGRVFDTTSGPTTAVPGSRNVTMLVEGDYSRADFKVHVWKRGTKAVVTDIDATLTTSDLQMVVSQIANIVGGRYSPPAYRCAAELMRLYAEKGYKIIYLTGRGGFLRSLTAHWLAEKGFPSGALSFMEWFMIPPGNTTQGNYKASYLADLVRSKGISLAYAYGNAVHDATAYLSAGIPRTNIFIIGKNAGSQGTGAITGDYCSHLQAARSLPRAAQP